MNLYITLGKNARDETLKDVINLTTDTFKALLMKPSFSFSATKHLTRKNVKATTNSLDYTVVASTKTFTRTTTGFITDGFVVGNTFVSTSSTNAGPYTISAITETTIRVAETVVDETAVGKTITCDDEFAETDGYLQDTRTVTFDVDNGAPYMEEIDWADFGTTNILTAAGILVYSDTSASDTVLLYAKFNKWTFNL